MAYFRRFWINEAPIIQKPVQPKNGIPCKHLHNIPDDWGLRSPVVQKKIIKNCYLHRTTRPDISCKARPSGVVHWLMLHTVDMQTVFFLGSYFQELYLVYIPRAHHKPILRSETRWANPWPTRTFSKTKKKKEFSDDFLGEGREAAFFFSETSDTTKKKVFQAKRSALPLWIASCSDTRHIIGVVK